MKGDGYVFGKTCNQDNYIVQQAQFFEKAHLHSTIELYILYIYILCVCVY